MENVKIDTDYAHTSMQRLVYQIESELAYRRNPVAFNSLTRHQSCTLVDGHPGIILRTSQELRGQANPLSNLSVYGSLEYFRYLTQGGNDLFKQLRTENPAHERLEYHSMKPESSRGLKLSLTKIDSSMTMRAFEECTALDDLGLLSVVMADKDDFCTELTLPITPNNQKKFEEIFRDYVFRSIPHRSLPKS